MFNLRTVVKTAIENLSLTYVDTVSDYDSEIRALEQLEKVVFDDSAVLITDWRRKSEVFIKGYNLVENELDLLVCAKSATAKTQLNTTVSDLCYGLNRERYSRSDCLDTNAEVTGELQKALDQERVHYQKVTLRVSALESTTQNSTNPTFSAPTLQITTPSTPSPNYAVSTGSPGSVLVETSFTLGDYAAQAVYYFITAAVSGSSPPLQIELILGGSTSSVTFSNITPAVLNKTSTGVFNYTIYAIFFDAQGASAIATKDITFTVT